MNTPPGGRRKPSVEEPPTEVIGSAQKDAKVQVAPEMGAYSPEERRREQQQQAAKKVADAERRRALDERRVAERQAAVERGQAVVFEMTEGELVTEQKQVQHELLRAKQEMEDDWAALFHALQALPVEVQDRIFPTEEGGRIAPPSPEQAEVVLQRLEQEPSGFTMNPAELLRRRRVAAVRTDLKAFVASAEFNRFQQAKRTLATSERQLANLRAKARQP